MWLANLWQSLMLWLGRGTPTEWQTQGPPDDEHPIPTAANLIEHREVRQAPEPWAAGWWHQAVATPAHPGRVGLPIVPRAAVVHTTDTYPGGFRAIVKSWTTQRGKGNAAHFMIGRTPTDGVVQFVPITRNGNHAGGPTHGNWSGAANKLIHPNTVAVGIELDGAGRLKQYSDGAWYHPDTGKEIPIADVYVDQKGCGWHKVTQYQLDVLRALLADLRLVLKPLDAAVAPSGSYAKNGVAYFAAAARTWLVGHVSLDPINKTDPGPQVMDWLRTI